MITYLYEYKCISFNTGIFQQSTMITTTATPLSLSPLNITKKFKDSKINFEENNYMKDIFDTNNMVNPKPHHDFKLNCISTLQKDNKTVDSNYPFYNPVHTPYVLPEKSLYSGIILFNLVMMMFSQVKFTTGSGLQKLLSTYPM
jgi:hypothetical protein